MRVQVTGEWRDGGVVCYGVRHTIGVQLGDGAPAQVVCEKTATGARLLGVERLVGGGLDEPTRKQHLGRAAISPETFRRVYADDSRRRRHYA